MSSLSIILPCYNESTRLPSLFEAIVTFSHCSFYQSHNVEFVIVDDASTDNSPHLIQQFQSLNPTIPLRLIKQIHNQGKGAAVALGDYHSQYEFRCFLDVDLSTSLDEIPLAFNKILTQQGDLLIGSRHCPGAVLVEAQGFFRYTLGRIFSFFTALFHESAFSDTQCGFKMWNINFSKQSIQSSPRHERWSFDVEWILKAESSQLKIIEHAVRWTNDPLSKVSAARDGLRMAIDVLRYRLKHGSKLNLIVAAFLILMGFQLSNPTYYLIYLFLILLGLVIIKRLLRYNNLNLPVGNSFLSLGVWLSLVNAHFDNASSLHLAGPVAAMIIAVYYYFSLKFTPRNLNLGPQKSSQRVVQFFVSLFFIGFIFEVNSPLHHKSHFGMFYAPLILLVWGAALKSLKTHNKTILYLYLLFFVFYSVLRERIFGNNIAQWFDTLNTAQWGVFALILGALMMTMEQKKRE